MSTFMVYASLWDRVLWWWHGVRYQIDEVMPGGDGALLIQCSCGGYALVRRANDGTSTVEEATCRRWQKLQRLQILRLPRARALP